MHVRHLKIGTRMAAGLGAILLIAASLLATGLWRSAQDRSRIAEATLQADRQTQTTAAMHQALLRAAVAVRNIGLQTEVDGINAAEALARKQQAAYQRHREALLTMLPDEASRGLLTALTEVTNQSDKHFLAAVGLAQQFNTEQAAAIIATKVDPLTAKAEALLEQLSTLADTRTAATVAAAEQSATRTLQLLGAVGTLGLALAGWIGWAMTRSITGPLRQAVEVAERVASGDLTRRAPVDGRDEPAQLLAALNAMTDSLAQVVGGVRAGSDSIATGSAQIASGNADLSARTEQQASALQQTAASMEELGGTVRQTADNAAHASRLADGASQVAERGGAVVAQVVGTMKDITDSSKRIADIIGVIDGIAFQTNILALNAAVEAARAGEQGRGFAVVAGEVRSLAQRSAEAAREIKSLIAGSVERVEAGNALVQGAGSTMVEVVDAIRQVTTIIGEISAATREQSSGVAQVGQAVTQMDHSTQQNAALVEQSAAAADSLRQQSQQLVQAVAVFRLAAHAG
jgi:methyl-accepting chemotaxis protein